MFPFDDVMMFNILYSVFTHLLSIYQAVSNKIHSDAYKFYLIKPKSGNPLISNIAVHHIYNRLGLT